MLLANATAIITDAFPVNERGKAMGINAIAAIAGSFVGLILGGILADWDWRLVFWVNVPFGLFGTVWAYRKLRELGEPPAGPHRLAREHHLRRRPRRAPDRHHLRHPALRRPRDGLDQPDGAGLHRRRHRRCWSSSASSRPACRDPMFNLQLFRIRPFLAGNVGRPLRLDRPRRPAVHADHLAAGHLAAAPRLQLRVHAAVGRHLHDPAHGRAARLGADRRAALGPLRRPRLRHRRHAARPR